MTWGSAGRPTACKSPQSHSDEQGSGLPEKVPPKATDGWPPGPRVCSLSPWPKAKWRFGNCVKSLICGESYFGNVFVCSHEQVVL